MTNLQEIFQNNLSISLANLPIETELVRDIQARLNKIGFIDMTAIALGTFDTNTSTALAKFQGVARRLSTDDIDRSFANKLLDITKDVVLPTAPDVDVTIALTGSVGKDGKNIASEVLAVKNRLADLGFPVSRTSNMGDVTIEIIKLFQAIINDKKNLNVGGNVDGRIDPNGKTHRALEKSYAPRWQEMLPGSVLEGFINSDYLALAPKQDGDFGTTWIVEAVRAAGEIYRTYLNTHPNAALIGVNDISTSTGGSFPPHAEHQVGLCCDLYLPRKDGNLGRIEVGDSQYDRAAMRAILQAFRSQTKHKVVDVFLNDEKLRDEGLCTFASGHSNHAHISIRPSVLSMF
jgi:peptidoglycan hydrolase-like protein with peptidoglycan-binding domain